MKIGILAVQGDFEAHAATLARMGVDYVFVRTPRDLEGVDAVILPGGESTTQWKFLVEEGLAGGSQETAERPARGQGQSREILSSSYTRRRVASALPPRLRS